MTDDDQLPEEPYCFEGTPPHLDEENQMRDQNRREDRGGRRRAGGEQDPIPVTKKEPALTRGAVIAVINLLGALGVSWAADLTAEQAGAIATVALVLAPIIQAVWTRYGVVAAAKVIARVSTKEGTIIAGEAAEAPTGSTLGVLGAPGYQTARVDVDPKLTRAYSRGERGATAGEIALIVIAVVLVLLLLSGVGVFR